MVRGGIASTETDDLEAMLSRSLPVLTQKILEGILSPPITNVVHHALTHGLEVLGHVSVGDNF